MALWTPSPAATLAQFDDADAVLALADSLKLPGANVPLDWDTDDVARALRRLQPAMRSAAGPSPAGRTWSAALAIPFGLSPALGGTVRIGQVSLYAGEVCAIYVDGSAVTPAELAEPLTLTTGSRLTVTVGR